MRTMILALLLLAAPFPALAEGELPYVLVLATGGTIAGEQKDPGTQEGYEIRRSIAEVIASVPEARKYARVEGEQFTNIPSPIVGQNVFSIQRPESPLLRQVLRSPAIVTAALGNIAA